MRTALCDSAAKYGSEGCRYGDERFLGVSHAILPQRWRGVLECPVVPVTILRRLTLQDCSIVAHPCTTVVSTSIGRTIDDESDRQ